MFVKVPKDINEYEHKVFKGLLTARNLKWGLISIASGITAYAILNRFLDKSVLSWIIMILVIPPFVFGFLEFDNLPADKFVFVVLDYYISPGISRYENDYIWINGYKEIKGDESGEKRKKKHKKRKKIKENEC